VRRIADRVLVMQAGRIVESNHAALLFAAPQHPATRQLLAAAPALPSVSEQD
jgi:peptide/nickel transport system ATP-binding protein